MDDKDRNNTLGNASAPAPLASLNPAPVAGPHPADAAIAAWMAETMSNSVISRNGEAWNYLTASLPALAARLKSNG